MIRRGSFVTLRNGDQAMEAMVVLASPNEDSLALMFDGAFRVGDGMLIGSMALLRTDGVYRDILTGTPIIVDEKL